VTRRLLLGYLALTLLVLASLEIPLGIANARGERADLTNKVEHDAVTLSTLVQDAVRAPTPRAVAAVAAIARRYARDTGGRVVVVDRRGRSVIDTGDAAPRDFSSRPEIARALGGATATGARHSDTLGTDLLYVAVPVAASGAIHGAVRVTYAMSAVDQRVRDYWFRLAGIAAVVLAAAALAGVALSRSIVRPLRGVEAAAVAAGEGDLSARAPVDGPEEVRALAHVFNETAAKLETLLRSQEDFVADASHQLRTPLTALRLRLENLERDVAPEGTATLDAALAETERLAGLVDGLLALARAGAADAPAVAVDARAALEERADAWSAFAAERGVGLALAGDGGRVRAAPGRLDQVLDNLIENALMVSPEGSTIRLRAERREGVVELHVVDEGPGLSRQDRERAFDRFWRGRGDADGSGLGLAVVRRLVEADDGRAELREAPGGGVDAVVMLRPA
jgi:signal transduction histidine kinase